MTTRNNTNSLKSSLAAIFNDPKYSDLEIHCRGEVFSVHRAVVCAQSKVLDAQCGGAFKEAGERIVKHDQFDTSTLRRMLEFMYHGSYTADAETLVIERSSRTRAIFEGEVDNHTNAEKATGSSVDGVSNSGGEGDTSIHVEIALTHVDVYAVSDFYDVPALKDLALRNFGDWECAVDPDEFTTVLLTIYANTAQRDDPLRKNITAQAFRRLSSLSRCKRFMHALADDPYLQEFAADLMSKAYEQTCTNHQENVQLQQDVTASRKRVLELENELTESRKRVVAAEARQAFVEASNHAFTQAQTASREREECRNCGLEFGGFIDNPPFSSDFFVRCRECKCKHFT